MSTTSDNEESCKSNGRCRLVWHRRDLRLHDNWLYAQEPIGNNDYITNCNKDNDDEMPTSSTSSSWSSSSFFVLSVYIFDQNDFEPRPSTCRPQEWDTVNTGPFAARTLIESVLDLRESLRCIGGELLIRQGSTLEILPQLIETLGPSVTQVCWNEEPGIYEQDQSNAMKQIIQQRFPNVNVQTSMQYTLYHPNDLPFGQEEWEVYLPPGGCPSNKKKKKMKRLQQQQQQLSTAKRTRSSKLFQSFQVVDVSPERWIGMPKIMGNFRKAAREKTSPRPCLVTPTHLSLPPTMVHLESGECPTLQDLVHPLLSSLNGHHRPILGVSSQTIRHVISKAVNQDKPSSETVPSRGGEHLALKHLDHFLQNHAATATRNLACVEPNESARISHFLAFGCLSPRKVVQQAEAHGESCQWVISHMTMRDFFLYTCLASGRRFYKLQGIPVNKKANTISWKNFIDTNTQQLWLKWALGKTGLPLVDACMRELMSTGYCSNRVRQNVVSVLTKDLGLDWRAGAEWFQFLLQDHCVGANWGNWLYFSGVGPDPKQRHFRTVSQALRYDPDGLYVRKWVSELPNPTTTTAIDQQETEEAHFRPWDFCEKWKTSLVVAPETQYTWKDLQHLEENGKLVDSSNQSD